MSIMRIKKGSKVEVFNKKDAPQGSWRGAEVICGNGHYYDVRYDECSLGTVCEAIVGRVNRKAIRPCPPSVEGAVKWIPGDIVEAFDSISWKIATVLKVMSDSFFLVRLVGSSRELKLCKSDIRIRQSWQNNEWIVVGKGSGNWEDGKRYNVCTSKYNQKSSPQVPQIDTKMKLCVEDDYFTVQNDIGFPESHIVSSRTLKRGLPYCLSHAEAYTGAGRKMRAVAKEGRHQGMVPWNPSPFPEKVDAVASPRETLGEKYMHASFNNKTTGFSEMDAERRKSNGDVGCFISRSIEPNDCESIASSVGSCSYTSDSLYRLPHQSFIKPTQGNINNSDDAESCFGWGYVKKCSLPTKGGLLEDTRRLELHVYHSTMEALYASGPLSWEQEVLVTNLRRTLHISNDEHLMELRNLASGETSLPISCQENISWLS